MLRRVLTMSAMTVTFPAYVLLMQLLPLPVQAQDESEPMATAASMSSTYDAVCASCHENPGDDILAPSREALRQIDPDQVLAALKDGPMVVYTNKNPVV